MYVEGYVTKVFVTCVDMTKQMSFIIDPTPPYVIKKGTAEYTLILNDPLPESDTGCTLPEKFDAHVRPLKQLQLYCPRCWAGIASLISLKASHIKIGVEFYEIDSKLTAKNLATL